MGLRLNAASAERQLQIPANNRSVSAFDLRGPVEPKAHGSPFFADLSLATQRKSGAPGTGLKTSSRSDTSS